MVKWTKEEIDQRFQEFTGDGDPDDPKEKKRQRIISAATELFVKFGYRKTSIDEIARHAGMAKGTIYLYFKTKGDLLMQAVVHEKMRYAAEFMPALTAEQPPTERMRTMLRLAFKLGTTMPLVGKLMSGDREILLALEEISPEMAEKIPATQHEYLGTLIGEAAASHGWTEEELADRSRVLLGLLYASGFINDERIRNGLSVERFADILADLLTDGIA